MFVLLPLLKVPKHKSLNSSFSYIYIYIYDRLNRHSVLHISKPQPISSHVLCENIYFSPTGCFFSTKGVFMHIHDSNWHAHQ